MTGKMQIIKTVNALAAPAALAALTVTTNATHIVNTRPKNVAREVTTHGNFSAWCADVTPYGASTSTIQASCGNENAGASVQYISHIDLNQCLINNNGQISGATNGNAMQSCDLGLSGRNACANCNGAWFNFECRGLSTNHTSLVDLDNYIGLEQTANAKGQTVWVLSCSTDTTITGGFDGCTTEGADDPSC